ncbi:hypothetical protein [Virgisporangium aliadipatigenens]|uniref:hypothetical protein n=1 Tax=Virgisporangium aliadipatigenens TaxID=741659 RepID=UPI0019433F3E|nr:hypothetical protein [Virgisporangium aliadipatigenens]
MRRVAGYREGTRDEITALLWHVQRDRQDLVPVDPRILPDGRWAVQLVRRVDLETALAEGPDSNPPAVRDRSPVPAGARVPFVATSTIAGVAVCTGGAVIAGRLLAAYLEVIVGTVAVLFGVVLAVRALSR